ncbi:MAG: hypothetical protein LAN62_08485 [Acidobacteriia bacterium]|nr:hypothetical protein [Terriglobia bacterium]
MTSLVQWVHLVSAVVGVGGIAFVLVILLPSLQVLADEQRNQLMKVVMGRFRWANWSAIVLLIASGLYGIRARAWEAPWGPYWKWLTVKIVLAFCVFTISLLLTLPIQVLGRFRARREMWLAIALGAATVVILISAYLRGF